MRRDTLLILVVATASVTSWWPLIIEPTLDVPWWVSLIVVGLSVGLATILSGRRWLHFAAIAAASTMVGVLAGYLIWPQEDGIAQSYSEIGAILATIAVSLTSLVAGLLAFLIPLSNEKLHRAVWPALLCVAAFGPLALAVRPSIVANRVARNERLASQRVSSLKDAVDRVETEAGNPGRACDGNALKEHYSGPPFTEQDWRYVAGNFVTEDGYAIGITIDCSQPGHYLISATPKRGKSDGTRKFCADASDMERCAPEWDPQRKRNACVPCIP